MRRKIRSFEIEEFISCDTETCGLGVWRDDQGFSVGICDPFMYCESDADSVRYWEFDVDPRTRVVDWKSRKARRFLQEIDQAINGTNDTRPVVFHNAKFDLTVLERMGIQVRQPIHDTSFASRVCNTQEETYALKPLAYKYCDIPIDDELELKDAVKACRMAAKRQKKDWKLGSTVAEDYWILQYAKQLGVEVNPDLCAIYCKQDCVRTAALWVMYAELLHNDKYYLQTYERELELLPIVRAMERRGFHISRSVCRQSKEEQERRAAHHLKLLKEASEQPNLNPGSSPQIAKILYGKKPTAEVPVVFGLSPEKRTNSGAESTDYEALQAHRTHPFVKDLIFWRKANKAAEDFFDKYLDYMRPDELSGEKNDGDEYEHGVLRPSLNQCGTVTGRFSSNDPNLQQVSNPDTNKTGVDVYARTPFGPRPGYSLYLVDFAQMELRVFADCAQVAGMLATIARGEDLNTTSANQVWGGKGNPAAIEAASKCLELGNTDCINERVRSLWKEFGWNDNCAKDGFGSRAALHIAEMWLQGFNYEIVAAEGSVGKSQSRQRLKQIMFAKIYGGGARTITELLQCSMEDANRFMKQIGQPFPEIQRYMVSLPGQAKRDGFIITRYGRKLTVDPQLSYRAVNYMIQGTCADMMKFGIMGVHNYLRQIDIDGHCILTVHDELIVEVKKEDATRPILREICRIMADTQGRVGVPTPVEMKCAPVTWAKKEHVNLASPVKRRKR